MKPLTIADSAIIILGLQDEIRRTEESRYDHRRVLPSASSIWTGDRQADLSVHGGEEKAVYCYPMAHYDYWKRELPGRELPLGMFGETSLSMACWKAQFIPAISSRSGP